jgi:superfamily I DNA/RNA helicase/RecB family exonuclease
MAVANSSTPAPQLVRAQADPRPRPRWDAPAGRLIEGARGFVRVLGGPGTGKTTLLADIAAARLRHAGVGQDELLVLSASRRAAGALRADITARLTGTGDDRTDTPRTVREPMVRTVHSYAFSVLRQQAVLHGLPGPRLLSGPEQDAVVRDLLAGDLENEDNDWPLWLRPALAVPGFAGELRDLLLRSAERGLGPEDLVALGEEYGRDEWVAAGRFGAQYEQVTLLHGTSDTGVAQSTAPALDVAELVAAALVALDSDDELLATQRARIRHLLVDDAQHLDPLQFELLRTLADGAEEFVLAGDPDQAVFSFRGADASLLADADPDGEHTLVLTECHRMAPEIRAAVGGVTARLPGAGAQRGLVAGAGPGSGAVSVALHPSEAAEASWLADQLRRAHLLDGVPWSEMAIVARSATRSFPTLQRAMVAAGVPVAVAADEVPLARQPAVSPFLELLRCAANPDLLDAPTVATLLASPLGGADPMALRRLRRGLRRLELASGGQRSSDELLVEAMREADRLAALEAAEAGALRRVSALFATARRAVADGLGVEQTLWQLWQGSGLERRWVAKAERGGTAGAQADRDLDAVVELFHAAARYADRLPGAGVGRFADYLAAQRISGDTLAPAAPDGAAVALVTAHSSAGREWTVVAVPSVQEGSWPDLRLRGTLLGVERLVDVLAGVEPGDAVSATAPLLAEERRLFLLAASRARGKLLVSAIRGEDEQPSRFVAELSGDTAEAAEVTLPFLPASARRSLVLADLVGELRRVVCDGTADRVLRKRAARELARLADAGVPGAHPDSWYGLAELSTDAPLREPDAPVGVSPSTVEVLARCPLRWLLERHGGQDPVELYVVTGTLVHALAQAAAEGAAPDELRARLDEAWRSVDAGAPWFSARERQRVHAMLDTFLSWLGISRGQLTQHAIEHEVTVTLPREEDGPPIRLRGRVDRLEADERRRPVVVDIKSGKTPVSIAEAKQHPQLAVYQLAAAYGAFTSLGLGTEPGGARLVYVSKSDRKTGAAERVQEPVDAETVQDWLSVVRKAAADSTGPSYQARENQDCPRCPGKSSCPLHSSGRQVTG